MELTQGFQWMNVEYDELNAALKETQERLGIIMEDGRAVTPGSLRRAFIHEKIVAATRMVRGVRKTDWNEVASFTGHHKTSTLVAHYDIDTAHSLFRVRA